MVCARMRTTVCKKTKTKAAGGGAGGVMPGDWDPIAPGAFDTNALADAAAALPHSQMARVRGLVSMSQERGSTARGRDLLRHMYLALLDATGSSLEKVLVRFAYATNHPLAHTDPLTHTDPDVQAGYTRAGTRVLPYAVLPRDVHISARTSCPGNPSGTSCFTDTPFVLMFVATNAFDGAIMASEAPLNLRPDARESELTISRDDVRELCDEGSLHNVMRMRDATRNIVAGMRSGPDNRALVEASVQAFRDAMQVCYPQSGFAKGQEDARTIYETLLMMSGWSRWYGTPRVSIARISGSLFSTDVYSTRVGLYVTLLARAAPQKLQDLADATLREHTDTTTSFASAPPSSGTMMLDTSALSHRDVVMPRDRTLALPFGSAVRRVKFRVFAVMLKTGDADGGHYYGYFWRNEQMYRYDDTASPPLQMADGAGAAADIAQLGLFYFAERMTEDAPPPSLPTLPPGSP